MTVGSHSNSLKSHGWLIFNVMCVETETGGEDLETVHGEEAK